MIKYTIALLFSVSLLNAQTDKPTNVNVGDVFEIGKSETKTYKHIDFPRANFIIKKGGIANYKNIEGELIVVTAIKKKKNGAPQVFIKRQDGGRFFGSHTTIKADFHEALKAGELQSL